MTNRKNPPKWSDGKPYGASPDRLRVYGNTIGKEIPKRRKPKQKKSPQRRRIWIAGGVLLLLLVLLLTGLLRKNGLEIAVGETVIGVLKNKSVTSEDLEATVTAQLEQELGTKIRLREHIITTPVRVTGEKKKLVATLDYMIPKIREKLTYDVEAASIRINGSADAILANQKAAQEVLDAIQKEYVPEGAKMEVSFVETVEIEPGFVDASAIIQPEQALEKLRSTTDMKKSYTVATNDTIYRIAAKADMTVEKFLEHNPGMTINTVLQVGQVVTITVPTPYLSVKTIETNVMTDIEPKTFEYQEDATKNKGYQKVIQQGKAGQKESTVQITRINGFVEEEKEISKKVVVEPVPEIILQGTK